MADDRKHAPRAFAAGPEGRPPTRAEAEAMAEALFDALTRNNPARSNPAGHKPSTSDRPAKD